MQRGENKQKTFILNSIHFKCTTRVISLFFIILFSDILCANAVTLYHPESCYVNTGEQGIFFSGKINKYESVFINGKQIYPDKGAFSYSVPLNIGENIFSVQSKGLFGIVKTKKYYITRTEKDKLPNQDKLLIYKKSYYKTTRDNVVLRSSPIDAGMNRLGYLPFDCRVIVNGSYNEFSRIYLTKDVFGWVKTEHLSKVGDLSENEIDYKPAELISTNITETHSNKTFIAVLSKDVPYSATVEDGKLIVTVYNLDCKNEKYTKDFNLGIFPRYSVCMKNSVLYVTQKKAPVNNANYSNKSIRIVIDAGHGGRERGTIGCFGDIEKDINLKVALCLKKLLKSANFDVRLVRERDKFVSLEDRINFGTDNDALIFISIHMNSVPISSDPNLNEGTVVFYFNPQCAALAEIMAKKISSKLKVNNEGSVQASFAVIRPTEYLGILAELVYMVNPKDVPVYRSKQFVNKSAEAIYDGLINYINSQL